MAARSSRAAARAPLQRAAHGLTGKTRPAPQPLQGSVALVEGHRVLDLDRYVPAYLAIVNNRLSRGASRLYLARFGVGVAEWRVMALLAIEPEIPATRVCEFLGMDKALVSRALTRLDAQGYLAFATTGSARRKAWRLNDRGHDLQERILDLALRREARLLTGVTAAQKETFLAVARQMMANLPLLEEEDVAAG